MPAASRRPSALVAALTAALVLATSACTDVLDVEMPDTITPDDVGGEAGAQLRWAGALGSLARAYSSGEPALSTLVGLFTDELQHVGVFAEEEVIDLRAFGVANFPVTAVYAELHQARVDAESAALFIDDVLPGDPRIAEVHNFAGFAYVLFGEVFCPGVPFSSVDAQGGAVFGDPATTAETFARALERFAAAAALPAASTDQRHLAAVGRARALLAGGEPAEAAAAVASVPTEWEYLIRSTSRGAESQWNALFEAGATGRFSLSDAEGGNGVPFRSLDDPRVPWTGSGGGLAADGASPLYQQTRYGSRDADVPLGSGIEARLIEAEASLAAGDAAAMIATLNALRATSGIDPLSDPGSQEARLDLLFQERALWLFGTAHRLGDLRRLVRQYGRDPADVYPWGGYFKGGTYGDELTFTIPDVERENPRFTGCLELGA